MSLSRITSVPRERRVTALALVAIGVVIAAGSLVPSFGPYVVLAIAIVSVAAFLVTREYGFAVPAGVMGGIGIGIGLAAGSIDAAAAGGGFMAALAAGFLATWVLGLVAVPAERHPWPLVPAAITGTIAIAALTGLPVIATFANTGAVVALVTAGVVLMLRRDGESPAES